MLSSTRVLQAKDFVGRSALSISKRWKSSVVEADYVIVGAGTAGCLLANRLSKDPETKVVLIEAGQSDWNPIIHVPVGYLYTMNSKYTDWGYKTSQQKGLNGRSIGFPRGKVLGGCSSINGMIFMTGNREDYDIWCQKFKNTGWDSKTMFSMFQEFVNFDLTTSEKGKIWGNEEGFNKNGKECIVQNQRLKWEILDDFIKACGESDILFSNNLNHAETEGSGYFQVNQRNGWRMSAKRMFLEPIKDRKNLKIITNVTTAKVNFGERKSSEIRATSVLGFKNKANPIEFKASKEIILSCGAVNTPQILQLSGVGNEEILSNLGLKTVINSPGVGENLHDHLQIRSIFRLKDGTKTLNSLFHNWATYIGMGLEYITRQTGPLSMAPSQLGVFAKSSPDLKHCDLEMHTQPLSLSSFGEPLHNFPAMTVSICNLKPTSRGRISLKSSDPFEAPVIDPNYLATDHDLSVAAKSLLLARKLMSNPAMAKYNPEEILPGKKFTTMEDLSKEAGNISSSIFHPVGTCLMSDADEIDGFKSVVDSQLKLKGASNVRIVDASIMPEITAGNTNAPVLAIAQKASEIILFANH